MIDKVFFTQPSAKQRLSILGGNICLEASGDGASDYARSARLDVLDAIFYLGVRRYWRRNLGLTYFSLSNNIPSLTLFKQ
jgi:hypothetical protein